MSELAARRPEQGSALHPSSPIVDAAPVSALSALAWPLALCAMVAVLLASFLGAAWEEPDLLVVALAGAVLLNVLLLVGRGRFDLLDPLFLYTIVYFVMMGLRAWHLDRDPAARTLVAVSDPVLSDALLVALLGFAALLLGYHLPGGRTTGRGQVAAPHGSGALGLREGRILPVASVLVAIALLIRARLFSQGWHLAAGAGQYYMDVSAGEQTLFYLSVLGTVGYVILSARLFSADSRSGLLVPWAIVLAIEVGWALLIGSKQAFITVIAAPVVCWHLQRRRVSPLVPAAALAAFFLVVFPVVTAYRNVVARADLSSANALQRGPGLLVELATSLREDFWTGRAPLEAVLGRLSGIDGIVAVRTSVPLAAEYQLGNTYLAGVLVAAVPSALAPGKYELYRAVSSEVPIIFNAESHSGIAMSAVAEHYWNFGLFGVFLGMATTGVVLRVAAAYFVARPSYGAAVMYAFLIPLVLTSVESYFAPLLSNGLRHVVIVGLVLAVLHRPIRSAPGSSTGGW
jgi:hypothetical protein